jgi:hypothetical protein
MLRRQAAAQAGGDSRQPRSSSSLQRGVDGQTKVVQVRGKGRQQRTLAILAGRSAAGVHTTTVRVSALDRTKEARLTLVVRQPPSAINANAVANMDIGPGTAGASPRVRPIWHRLKMTQSPRS